MSAQKDITVREKVQALQNKLPCVAKQSPGGRFGALYDKRKVGTRFFFFHYKGDISCVKSE